MSDASPSARRSPSGERPPRAARLTAYWVALVVLATVVLLIWTTADRVDALGRQNHEQATLSVEGAARDIEVQLYELSRGIRLFVLSQETLLKRLSREPGNESLFNALRTEVSRLFPESVAINLTGADGRLLVNDFDGLIGEVCRTNVQEFSHSELAPDVVIHPHPENYHFDLMTHVTLGDGSRGIFYVSFRPEVLTQYLAESRAPAFELLVLNRDVPNLIEANADGARDRLNREFHLGPDERLAILAREAVAGTRWEVVALPQSELLQTHPGRLWITTAVESALLVLVGLLAIWQLMRTARREEAHRRLLDSINRAEARFIADNDPYEVFGEILSDTLDLSGSHYGFIGELRHRFGGAAYLKVYAVADGPHIDQVHNSSPEIPVEDVDPLLRRAIDRRIVVISNGAAGKLPRAGLPKGHPPVRCFYAAPLIRGDEVVGVVGLANRPGGFDSSVSSFLEPLISTCGNLFGALGAARQKAMAETALRDSEIRHRSVLNNVVDGIITIDEEGHIESFNPAAEQMFGYAAEEIVGDNVSALMPEPDRETHDAYLRHYLRTGESGIVGSQREVYGRRKDGSLFPMELAVSEMQLGNSRRFTGLVRDISERRQAERTLRETTALHQAIFQGANHAIIATDHRGLIIAFNSGAERLLGYDAAELVGIATVERFHDAAEVAGRAAGLSQELRAPVEPGFEVFAELARRGAPEEEWTYIRKDGTRVPVLLSVSALTDGDGEITGYLGIASDITERKKVDIMKNEFISTVSHELRTPLTAIRGALGLVSGGTCGEIPDKAHSLLEIAANNSDRLVRLINDMLDIEKIESGSLKFDIRRQPLAPIIEQTLEIAAGYAEQYGVKIELVGSLPSLDVAVDADRINQVMLNLLSNAAKFSPPGERVEVAVQVLDRALRVRVSDRGPGITPEFRSRIFQKFAQADASDSRQKGGTGLGLSISRAIIQKHHGRIGFNTRPDGGSCFYFELPLPDTKIARHPSSTLPAPTSNILVCENNRDIANLIEIILQSWGYRAHIAQNAQEAVRLLRHERYDAVTLDIGLPGNEGLSLVETLRSTDETRDLPVVVVSAEAEVDTSMVDPQAHGIIDWIHTPIDPARLRRALDRAARGLRAQCTQVLHVEKDSDVVQVLASILGDEIELTQAANVEDARGQLERRHFDLIILETEVEDGSALTLLPDLDRLQPRPPVVVFSAQDVDEAVLRTATAVLVKSRTTNQDLVETVNRVIRQIHGESTEEDRPHIQQKA